MRRHPAEQGETRQAGSSHQKLSARSLNIHRLRVTMTEVRMRTEGCRRRRASASGSERLGSWVGGPLPPVAAARSPLRPAPPTFVIIAFVMSRFSPRPAAGHGAAVGAIWCTPATTSAPAAWNAAAAGWRLEAALMQRHLSRLGPTIFHYEAISTSTVGRSTPPDVEMQGKCQFEHKKKIPKYNSEYQRVAFRGYSARGIPWVFRQYSWQKKTEPSWRRRQKPSHHVLCLCCVERRTKDENTAASTTGLGSAVHHTNGCGRAGRKTDKHTADSRARQQT